MTEPTLTEPTLAESTLADAPLSSQSSTAVTALNIMVLVGTDVHPFDRLIDWVENYPASIDITWVVQSGSSRSSKLPGAKAFLDREELAAGLAAAQIVICHGGPATITEARRSGHVPLVVPRDPERGEHVDDHQQRFSRRLGRSALVEICETQETLYAALERAEADPKQFWIDASDADAAVIATALRVGQIADGLVATANPGRLPRQLRRSAPAATAAPSAVPSTPTVPSSRTPPDDDVAALPQPVPAPVQIRPAQPAPAQRGPMAGETAPSAGEAISSITAPAEMRRPVLSIAGGLEPVRVLYIGGWGRSGSTLIERLLGQMPELVGAGEVTHLWQRGLVDNELCACGQPFRDCPFWTEVGAHAFGGWDNVDAQSVIKLKYRVDRTRFIGRLALPTRLTRHRADLAAYNTIYRKVYAAISAVAGKSIVIDSSKHASLAFALRHDEAIDLRVLHVVRDGRGVAYSWKKEVQRPEAGGSLMPQYSIGRSGVLWSVHNWLFQMLRWEHRKTRLMRYEDVMANPDGKLAEVREFLDLSPQRPAFLSTVDGATVAQVGASHSIAGNPMRFTNGGITLRTDSAWRSAPPQRGRFLITVLTWPGRLRYGYLDRRRSS